MSDDLQKEIDRLKAEASTQRAAIDKLTRDLAGAHDDLKEVRGEARDRRHEGKKLAEQLDAVSKERDEFKTKAESDPEGLRKSLSDAHGVIRGAQASTAAFSPTWRRGLKVNDAREIRRLPGSPVGLQARGRRAR